MGTRGTGQGLVSGTMMTGHILGKTSTTRTIGQRVTMTIGVVTKMAGITEQSDSIRRQVGSVCLICSGNFWVWDVAISTHS